MIRGYGRRRSRRDSAFRSDPAAAAEIRPSVASLRSSRRRHRIGAAGTGVDRVRRARGVARASAQAETFATKYGYEFDPNQELIALGVANAGSGLLGGLA